MILCRFLACLAAAMRPEDVLNEEEKRTRFRKAIKKGTAKVTSAMGGNPSSSQGKLTFGSR